jgi:hypothetical protein
MRKGLKENLLKYLQENEGWYKKVNLYVIADELGYSPETAGRALRDLAEPKDGSEPKILVSYYDSKYAKGLAMYAKNNTPKPSKEKYIITGRKEDGSPILELNPNYEKRT